MCVNVPQKRENNNKTTSRKIYRETETKRIAQQFADKVYIDEHGKKDDVKIIYIEKWMFY